MAQYEKRILNALLDAYEGSLLFSGENKVAVNIAFPFTKKRIPEYFEESSLAYEDIHACVGDMENKGFLAIEWKKDKKNHILNRVLLRIDRLPDIYAYLHRTPRTDLIRRNLELLREAKENFDTPVCIRWITYLEERIVNNKSVKEYIELADPDTTKELIKAIFLIEQNKEPCYVREFSIRHFSDSKFFERMYGTIAKVMHTCGSDFKEKPLGDILAEYGIYHTPNYVYVKGDITLLVRGKALSVGVLRQGIGISGEDSSCIQWRDFQNIRQVITIENLTTFYRWHLDDSLIIYLGGYHNRARRVLLQTLYRTMPHAEYYHFGDIDVGGFEIYEDLCAKTKIPFRLYKMDMDTLKRYERFGRKLTENDKKRILELLARGKTDYDSVLQYMLRHNVKLEQECIE